MILTREQVEHIAGLARLDLSEDEIVRFREQLSSILEHFRQLEEVDTSGISPSARAIEIPCTLREDIPGKSLSVDELLANAPDTEENRFRVPPIIT